MSMTMPAMSSSKLEWVLYYESLGFSVIPLCAPTKGGYCAAHGGGCKSAGKTPMIRWEKYQNEQASITTLNEWWGKWPDANIGIVTGAISGLVVIDIESGGSLEGLIPTVISKTGGDGWHYYYKHPGRIVPNAVRVKDLVDIRGDGGYVVAPPSLHLSGRVYEWKVAPNKDSWVRTPNWVLNMPKTISKRREPVIKGVSEGLRNQSAASVVGKFLSNFPESDWEGVVWPALVGWNKQNTPPLDETELKEVFESIAKKEKDSPKYERNSNQKNVAGELVQLINKSGARFFNDQFQEPYISIFGDGRKVLKLGSRQFKFWLSKFAWDEMHKAIGSEAVQTTTNLLGSQAMSEADQIPLNVRVAWYENKLWYDLGNSTAVEIDEKDWRIVDCPPILFRQLPHQNSHPLPTRDGNIDSFLNFSNIKDPNEQLLLKVFLISSFIPGFSHPALVLHGSQGAAKTTLCRLIKSLVDPSQITTVSIPKNLSEFVQLASHHWTLFFDNLSKLPDWFSDAISRAVTGDGQSKRVLYSDDDDKIYQFQIVLGLNGIPQVVDKPDLLDRSILLHLARIPEDRRMTEKDVRGKFIDLLPGLLGAIFTSLSSSVAGIGKVSLQNLPRMADFAKWGCAIAVTLGYTETDFINAYNSNIGRQNDEAIDASIIAIPILSFMQEKDVWEGTATELLSELEIIAGGLKIDIKEKSWPKNGRWLGRLIEAIIPNLEVKGLKVKKGHNGNNRTTRIWHYNKETTVIPNINNQGSSLSQDALL